MIIRLGILEGGTMERKGKRGEAKVWCRYCVCGRDIDQYGFTRGGSRWFWEEQEQVKGKGKGWGDGLHWSYWGETSLCGMRLNGFGLWGVVLVAG